MCMCHSRIVYKFPPSSLLMESKSNTPVLETEVKSDESWSFEFDRNSLRKFSTAIRPMIWSFITLPITFRVLIFHYVRVVKSNKIKLSHLIGVSRPDSWESCVADSSATGMTSSAKIFCWRMPRVVGSKCEFYILTYTDIATSITEASILPATYLYVLTVTYIDGMTGIDWSIRCLQAYKTTKHEWTVRGLPAL